MCDDQDVPDVNLTELAARYGVSTRADGRAVPESTLRAVLGACGAFDEADPRPLSVPAALVTRQSDQAALRITNVPAGMAVTATLTREDGGSRDLETAPDDADDVSGAGAGNDEAEDAVVVCRIPADLPTGYHRIDVTGAGRDDCRAHVSLIVAPDVLELPERIGRRRHWGYEYVPRSVRSDLSWGVGDFADMAEFARLAAGQGASFVATTPLQASAPATPIDASPYAASTREFLDPLLIRVEDIREVAYMPAATRSLIDWEASDQRVGNTSPGPMDLDDLWEAKKEALSLVFATPRSPARQSAFDQFAERGGRALDTYCRWCTAAEYFGADAAKWPAAVQPGTGESSRDTFGEAALGEDSAALKDFRRTSGERREFYAWLQWIADTQLRRAAAPIAGSSQVDPSVVGTSRADTSGGCVGLVAATVVSASLAAAEAWRYGGAIAPGVRAGSSQSGPSTQAGSATMSPGTLRALEFAPVIDAVRAALRHGGGVRLDRPTELFNSWWVPDGVDAVDGTSVAMDADDLLSIVVLEAHRAGAVLMAGDSAGLDDDQLAHLAARGIAVPQVVWDQVAGGALATPDSWSADGVAVVSPHGPVPTAAFLSGEHLDTGGSDDADERRMEHGKLRDAVVSSLREMSLIDQSSTEREILEALYAYVASTPARFVSVALADAVGDRRLAFTSGTVGAYPEWRMPLADGAGSAVTLGRLVVNPRAAGLVGTLADIR